MNRIVGIDIGSVAVSLAVIEHNGAVIHSSYQFHKGAIRETIADMLKNIDKTNICGIAMTSSGPNVIRCAARYDTQISVITAVKHFHKEVGSILFVGGENFGLISFNEQGDYERYRSNSSCAAGTGSFLDQQAKRLNLKSIESLSSIAFCNMDISPKIATRCAVFAKTDLIHAQQEGYSIGQISDGLCEGLAKNVIDTLMPDQKLREPLILAGGVSMNQAVVKHFKSLLHIEPVIGPYSQLYGAIGAALLFVEEMDESGDAEKPLKPIDSWEDIIVTEQKEKRYSYPPLSIRLSSYPDFSSNQRYIFEPSNKVSNVEVDIYEKLNPVEHVYLGIDIGSTSTKAVLLGSGDKVLAGLYTRTSGQPVKAVQALFECIDRIAGDNKTQFEFIGVGTTGSGRKFIGRIINADLIVDEITAHARAAYELDNEVDTIIEIGGQDAKFTTMKNGMVTFSVMNNVCAAGTGSFIEEQAEKLGVNIADYAGRAINIAAPCASDRCTVFMERDINNYLSEGFTVDEVLASVLHSVRENYISKVAVEANIGEKICFQGATARNKALIAAFEHKLKKPVFVSKFCHLTGALGSALILSENKVKSSIFRGTELYKNAIPVENEICELCHNHCKINKVTVQGETVAFGFLCGRDYDTKQYVGAKRAKYDLLSEREKIFRVTNRPKTFKSHIKIGIPHALYLAEEMPLWKHFFNTLGVEVVTSASLKEPIKYGKKLAGAEFCAPISAFHGHVAYLADKCDYIFLPIYLDEKEKDRDLLRLYCYYTQFAASLATGIQSPNLKDKVLSTVFDHRSFQSKIDLSRLLKTHIPNGYWEIYNAYEAALAFYNESRNKLRNIYEREQRGLSDISVVLLGRPYTVLQNSMNKGIPDIFSKLEIKSFYQDMLPYHKEEISEIDPLLKQIHWNYPAKILKAALYSAINSNIYPVFITSFKCGPDSFTIEYFKRIMDKYNKPYLILELDEHDSSVGYETRIEAAVRSFRNHYSQKEPAARSQRILPIVPEISSKVKEKTLLFPTLDPLTSKLLEAVLIKEGFDARLVPFDETTVQRAMRTNTGQCLPVNIIAQSYIDYIEENIVDPATTTGWIFASSIACNIRMYPQMIKSLMEAHGKGMELVDMYIGEIDLSDISIQATIDAYFAFLFGGMLRKIGCKIRPYEVTKGETDKVIAQSLTVFYNALIGGRNKDDAVSKVVALFKKIEVNTTKIRPKVAIFGDMYARDNEAFNQNLIHRIEEYGGEAITTPMNEYAKMIADSYIRRWFTIGKYKDAFLTKTVMALVTQLEKSYYRIFNELLDEPVLSTDIDYEEILSHFHVKVQHSGESADNLIKIAVLLKHYPDISLFVQTNPAFCCAGLVTEAMVSKIEELFSVPVVTLNYDGTGKNINEKIRPYIKYPRKKH